MNKHPGLEFIKHRRVLQPEGGITQISLQNADLLLREAGNPTYIELKKIGDEYLVLAKWPGLIHMFTGFSWGYGGEGPSGLNTFLRACDVFPGWNAYNLDKNLGGKIELHRFDASPALIVLDTAR
jgi:hypothetical protein